MGVNSIGNVDYSHISSGKRINSGADDAAGLAIAEKLETQTNGYDVGASNAASARDMLNVAEGGLSSINDSLQRMRELSVQASNSALYTSRDLSAMQKEIDQLKQGIQDAAKGTSFNTMSLLDGSMADLNIATNPDGTGMKISMANSTLEALGISDFDVTSDFDISALDKAIEMVNSARSDLGSQSNALESAISYNNLASYNTTASKSRIEDLDMFKEISEQQKNKILQDYQTQFAKKKMEDEANINKMLF